MSATGWRRNVRVVEGQLCKVTPRNAGALAARGAEWTAIEVIAERASVDWDRYRAWWDTARYRAGRAATRQTRLEGF